MDLLKCCTGKSASKSIMEEGHDAEQDIDSQVSALTADEGSKGANEEEFGWPA